MNPLKAILAHRTIPEVFDLDRNSAGSISVYRKIIDDNIFLKEVYDGWYRRFLPSVEATRSLDLPMIELGCGQSHLKNFIPEVIKTDVVKHDNVDVVVNAETLPYEDNGLRAIFMVEVFHHLPDPGKFLSEVERCLSPGGRLVMIEPSNSPLSAFLVRKFHRNEYYDDRISDWKNPVVGRLNHANNAIPSIVFIRDRKKMESLFPHLRVCETSYHTFLMYLMSGGFSYYPFLPKACFSLVKFADFALTPFTEWLSTAMTIVVEKTP